MPRFPRFLPLLALLCAVSRPAAAIPDGDFNSDGTVNVADATAGLQAIVGLRGLSPEEKERADVAPVWEGVAAPDGALTIDDVVAVLRKIVGLQSWAVDTLGALPVMADLSADPNTMEVNLTAAPAKLSLLPGKTTDVFAYNGQVPGPTLEVKEGDRVIVHFTNNLPEPTNVHWHGLHIPAESDGGPWNPVPPGGTFDYEFTIPQGSAGTYWYHPHVHELTATQVAKGLAGAILVRAADDPLASLPEKTMVLWDNTFNEDGSIAGHTQMDWMAGREGDVLFVSGKIAPIVPIRNGGVQRWRIINASAARFYRLALTEGSFRHVGSDGGLFGQPVMTNDLMITPGERVEILVQSPANASGQFSLVTMPYNRGGMAPDEAPLELVKVTATPTPPVPPPTIPDTLRPVAPIDVSGVEETRFILFSGEGTQLKINNKVFDHMRVDETAALNTTEVWEVTNVGSMDHPFHLHGFTFQVLERGGLPEPFPMWKDTVNVPKGGSVRFAVRFTDFAGKRPFHCHILEHEDLGMMATLEVTQ